MKIISPITIDMGAKYTGVYLSQYLQGATLDDAQKAGIVVMHNDNITISQVDRTTKRHQTRTSKRRKLAKRLLRLILKHHYQINFELFSSKEQEAINSLLNRRGFTYLSENVDEELLASLPCEPFSLHYHSKLPTTGTLLEAYHAIICSIEEASNFQNDAQYGIGKKEFEAELARTDDFKADKKILSVGLDAFKEAIDSFIKAEVDGHKIRSQYLENICNDICNHEDYEFLRSTLAINSFEPLNFANLVGHISNLQLRVLRRYFNDETMKSGDLWQPEKLHKVFFRNVSALHCKTEQDKKNQITLFEKRPLNIIELFESTEPTTSIPPFEDQNNRRPPKCQSLVISSERMDKLLPLWTSIVPKIIDELERNGIEVKEGLNLIDIKNKNDWAQALQRTLELSRAHDPFLLRSWIANEEGHGEFVQRGKDNFKRIVQGQNLEAFIQFATQFYKETEEARSALWFDAPERLLTVCGKKPPHKANQLKELLSGAFSHGITDEQKERFQALWEENPRVGKRTIKGWCKFASENQKEYGNALNHQIKRNRILESQKKKVEDKKLLELDSAAQPVAENIATHLNIPAQRFNNVFDLAKLYNLMEQSPKGFSRNCRCCTKENAWRSMIKESNNASSGEIKEAALGLRLPADTTRPFDGMLDRLLDKQAYQIALAKIKQLPQEMLSQEIPIPIIIEENRFRFTSSLNEIKRNSKNKKNNEKRADELEKRWLDKDERIKAASKGICPYTGKALETGGEIDHIIPRAESKGRNQGVFNHEANLIYCSATGNSIKDRHCYTLNDLHDNYLIKQFGHSDVAAIKQELIRLCAGVIAKGELLSFTEIDDEELRKAIRHGLFVEELRVDLMRLLYQSMKTRVNGTQAYLAKLIMKKIRQHYSVNNLEFAVRFIEPDKAQSHRRLLAEQYPQFGKIDHQPVASHVIDAAMVMAAALEQPHTRDILQTAGLEGSEWLYNILPKEVDITSLERKAKYEKSQIESQKLFKDGLYGEHFVPVIFDNEKMGVGFNSQNALWLHDQEQAPELWWQILSPYLNNAPETFTEAKKASENNVCVYSINKTKAFELLFLVAKQPATDDELCSADLLEALCYATQKMNVLSSIYNEGKRRFENKETLLKDEDWAIKIEIKSNVINKKMKKLDANTLQYQGKQQWEKLVSHPFVQERLGCKMEKDISFEQEYDAMIQMLFPQNQQNTRSHKKVRKNWSLPKIAKAAGTAYRARRMNANGEVIWQRLNANGLSAIGYEQEKGIVNFKNIIPITAIENSPNLIEIGSRYNIKHEAEPYNNWRQLDLAEFINNDEHSVDSDMSQVAMPSKITLKGIALSTKEKVRFKIRVVISAEDLLTYVIPNIDNGESIQHWSQLSTKIRLHDAKCWKQLFNKAFNTLLGTPEFGDLSITKTGEDVTLEYKTFNNQCMKDHYQRGKPI